MKLYEYKNAISVVPGRNTQDASDKYAQEVDNGCDISEKQFEVIVPHEDFVKLFRLARTLNDIDQYNFEEIEALVDTYAKKLGYSLSKSQLWTGILKWAERFTDVSDEDIEDWLN